jgi:hypothetical protein
MVSCPCCEKADHQPTVTCAGCELTCIFSLSPYWQRNFLALQSDAELTNRSLAWETLLAKMRYSLANATAILADCSKILKDLK